MITWNPFEPSPQALELALSAYWEARRACGVYTNNNNEKKKPPPQPKPHARKFENFKIQYGLDTYQLHQSRRYPIASPSELRLRLRQVQRIRMAAVIMRHKQGWVFKTKTFDTEIEVRRIL